MPVTGQVRPPDAETAAKLLAYLKERAPAWVASLELHQNVISMQSNKARGTMRSLLASGQVEDKYTKDPEHKDSRFLRFYRVREGG